MDVSIQLLKDENIRQDGNQFNCLTCQKKLESIQVLKDHVRGKNHIRKKQSTSTSPYYCDICKKDINSKQQYDDHVKGRNHIKNSEKLSSVSQNFENLSLDDSNDRLHQQNENSARMPNLCAVSGNNSSLQMKYIKETKLEFGVTCFHCFLCKKVFLNGDEAKKHAQGKEHSQKMARERAPDRELPALVTSPSEGYDIQTNNLTEFKPRDYQIEIFLKTIKKDSVIFLPTGKENCFHFYVVCLLKSPYLK